jgi:hypothetical protein|tara:strand:- start:220 stop:408 length:189 start_codon:yes stop_codon:yes gene_type:complete
MTNINKNWFDTHVEVMTLNDDKEQEQKIKDSLKNTLTKPLTEDPSAMYKKAVNTLKRKVKKI